MSKTILVVDDEMDVVEIFAEELQLQGYKTLSAFDGKQGFEIANRDLPDAIISDINMPNMDGLTMLEKLNESGRKIPVIFVTAYSDTRKIQKAWKLGAFDFLEKPAEMSTLHALVKKALEFGNGFTREPSRMDTATIAAPSGASSAVTLQITLAKKTSDQVHEAAKKAGLSVEAYIAKKLES